MNKKYIILFYFILLSTYIYAQDIYSLKTSKIKFFAGTPVEDIEAFNNKANSFMNIKTGDIVISIPNKEFKFKNSLMEEHFNENYMESEKFPKSEFKGKIIDVEKYDFTKTEPFKVKVQGNLSIHGITKPKTIDVTIRNSEGKIIGESSFSILLADYNIQRPQILWEKIAENISVTTNFSYELLKK